MTDTALRLKGELLRLSEEDRVALARALLESLDDQPAGEVEAEWEAELDRRFAEIESGQAIGEPARKVIEELREKYK